MKWYLYILFMVVTIQLSAQTPLFTSVPKPDTGRVIRFSCAPSDRFTKNPPVILVNGHVYQQQDINLLSFLNPANIDKIQVHRNDKLLTEKYGQQAMNGVISITLKSKAPFMSVTQFIQTKYPELVQRGMKICVNGNLIVAPSKMMMDPTIKLTVKKWNARYKVNGEFISAPEEFINITTTN